MPSWRRLGGSGCGHGLSASDVGGGGQETPSVALRARFRKTRGVAGHQVDLEVEAVARPACAPCRHRERMGDQEHGEEVALDGVHRERGAVEADRALFRDEAGDGRARGLKRAVGPQGPVPGDVVAATMSATPSTWPETIWPPSSSPIFSERSRLSFVPGPHVPAVVRASVSAAASTSNQQPPPSRGPCDHRQARAGAGDGGADGDASAAS